jgi:lipoprotein-releasing system ATP-binding protein
MPQIEIKNLKKTYTTLGKSTEVLRGINLEIHAGETLAVVGASGAGKSTLLHIIGTLDSPTEGKVIFEGEEISKKSDKSLEEFRNQSLGFIFQFHHLLPDFSAEENVVLPLLIRGISSGKARKKARHLLDRVELSHRLTHRPSELSGGEQQRVAIARALVGDPKAILADEPTGNLDALTGGKIFDLLLSLNRELRATLVVVTHNHELAVRLGRTVRIVDGIIENS